VAYFQGIGLETGKEFTKRDGFNWVRISASARDITLSLGVVIIQLKQRLVNEGRKIKPPKEPQKWQPCMMSTLKRSLRVNHGVVIVCRIM
jgi:hypothetical protein